jgi:hypothetical protein
VVGVGRVAATDTPERVLGDAVLLRQVPTSRADAGGVAGVHGDHDATGTFSLVREDAQETPPTRIENASVQSGLRGGTIRQEATVPGWVRPRRRCANHARDVQFFVRYLIIGANEGEGGLVRVANSLATHGAMQRGDFGQGPGDGARFSGRHGPLGTL